MLYQSSPFLHKGELFIEFTKPAGRVIVRKNMKRWVKTVSKKRKAYLIATVICGILLFAWLLGTVLLTGGREISDFTTQDKQVMTGFIVVESITLIATFTFAGLAGRQLRRDDPSVIPKPKKRWEKAAQAQSIGIAVAAVLIAFGVHILGIYGGKALAGSANGSFRLALWVCLGLAVVLPVTNVLINKALAKKMEEQKVADMIHFIVSHRDAAEETARQKRRFLGAWRRWTAVYGLLPLLLGLCASFSGGVLYNSQTSTPIVMVSALLVLATLSRIRFAPAQVMYEEEKAYIKEEDYPRLYALAKRAAQQVGSHHNIRIALLSDYNAGVTLAGDVCVIFLGVLLLNTLSEEELYHILLHECSHAKMQTGDLRRSQAHYDWICGGRTPHFASSITGLFFRFFDGVYLIQFNLYRYAASIQEETQADLAMCRWGDRNVAASALLKLKYYELYCWEKDVAPDENIFTKEQPDKDLLTRRIRDFRQTIHNRQAQWNDLIEKEILPRTASHPTIKMRLQTLEVGVSQVLFLQSAEAYNEECARGLRYVEELICEDRLETYEADRKENYLKPKSLVEDWEAAGKPLVAEEYGRIVWALQKLSRLEEAIELCERAIRELPAAAACQGYFIRGCYRLHSYEDAGISDIYFAIETNKNYLDEGMPMIGNYCCLTGNQQELERYRERSVELSQEDKDMYSQILELKKNDHLSSETLPEGMLEGILAYIRSVEDGQIENIYLVRKTVTETFFTSAMVVRFTADADEEACDDILQKIFDYLDTSTDWQFSLFDYRDVARVKVERIEKSCVYTKNDT